MLRSVPGLSLLEMPVNLSQYCGSLELFSNRSFFVRSKVSHFTYFSDNNDNKNDLGILLLKLMFVFKGNDSKHKKIIFI